MNKLITKAICMLFLITTGVNAIAQQTSLTIDNQSPGWLSSKIGYQDQQTVENLKVIGYLNLEDLQFIARLMKENSLHGRLDLEEANIVSTTGGKNNYLYKNVWGADNSSFNRSTVKLSYLSMPKSLEDGDKYAMGQLDLDTLYFNSTTGYAKALNATVKHLIIGENLTVLTYPAFSDIRDTIEAIVFPPTLREIREKYVPNYYAGISCKISNGENLREFPSLERLYASFQVGVMPDSVFLPNIRVLSLGSMFKAGMHVFISENIDTITNMDNAKNIHLHFASSKPPYMEGDDYYHHKLKNESYFKLYVPMGSAAAYRARFENGGTNVTIIEEVIDVTDVTLDKHELSLNVGDAHTFSVEVLPEKATYKTVNWHSDNIEVAEVNSQGIVTAKKAGIAMITVSSISNPEVKDSCEIIVIQPAQSIEINETAITLIQNKGTMQLDATISPDNTTDKTILWSSSDTIVAVVDSCGFVTARKAGKAIITAKAASNTAVKATCEVTVIQPVEGITLNETSIIMEEFGNMVKLNATILPEDASDKSVRWSSSNPNVCTVTQNGTVVAVGNGTATVIATTVDGDIPASCVVNVKDYVYDTNRDGAIDVADIAAIISKMAAMARSQKQTEE